MTRETQPGDPKLHRVQVKTGAGFAWTDVMAKTGDEAALEALKEFPGSFVAHVEPTPQKPKAGKARITSDEKMVEVDSLAPDAQPVA